MSMSLEQVRDQLREWGKADHSPLCVNCGYWADAIDAALQSRAQGEALLWIKDNKICRDTILSDERMLADGWEPLYRRSRTTTDTHCENCGCTWLDDGLNPIGCPYCKAAPPAAAVTDEMVECASEAYDDVYTAEITANTSADNKHQAIRAALEAALGSP